MSPVQYQRVKAVCNFVLDAEAEDRESVISSHCTGDLHLEIEVRRVLASLDQSGVLDTSPVGSSELKQILGQFLSLLEPGKIIAGRFRIERLLGTGGMGQVWEAYDQELGELIAIKTIRPEIATDRRTVERFKREVLIARRVTNPHVCRIYDFFVHEEVGTEIPFLTMQLLSGETLAERLNRQGKIALPLAIQILEHCAVALGAAHAAGLIHRDFKPGNVMLVPDAAGLPRAVVTDFGLARELAHGSGIRSGTQSADGTPAYMPPEQAEGRELTTESDVFSFGVVACEVLTGKRPADGGLELLPPNWRAALGQALDHNPKRRFARSGDLVRAASSYQNRRHLFTGIMLLTALAIAAAAYLFVLRWQAGREVNQFSRSIAILPFDVGSNRGDQLFGEGLAGEIYSALTRIPGLRVVSDDSNQLRKSNLDLKAIAYRLQTNTILKGSIQHVGGRVLIGVRVVDPLNKSVLWAQSFDYDAQRVGSIQHEVVRGVVSSMGFPIATAQAIQFNVRNPESEAYAGFLRGRAHWAKRDPESMRAALVEFDRAIELDSEFAPAWAARADTLGIMAELSLLPGSEAFPKAREAALRAVMLDPKLPEAIAAFGLIQSIGDWDFYNARITLARALQLQPGSLQVHSWLGAVLTKLGQHEAAIAEGRLAQSLDPLAPRQILNLGWMYIYAKRFPEALATAQQLQREHPDHMFNCLLTVQAFLGLNDVASATKASGECTASMTKLPVYHAMRANVLVRQGRKSEAAECVRQIIYSRNSAHVGHAELAAAYVALGEYDQAFYWLEQGIIHHDPLTVYVPFNIAYDALRPDRRYERFLERIGFFKENRQQGSNRVR